MKKQIIESLYDKDTIISYKNLLQLETISDNSNELYSYFNEFIEMLNAEKSYIKVRGFRLICKQAKWDKNNKIDKNIEKILNNFRDLKPTEVRQCLKCIKEIIIYKPKLKNIIQNYLETFDYTKYKDTMSPLIKKDIEIILNFI